MRNSSRVCPSAQLVQAATYRRAAADPAVEPSPQHQATNGASDALQRGERRLRARLDQQPGRSRGVAEVRLDAVLDGRAAQERQPRHGEHGSPAGRETKHGTSRGEGHRRTRSSVGQPSDAQHQPVGDHADPGTEGRAGRTPADCCRRATASGRSASSPNRIQGAATASRAALTVQVCRASSSARVRASSRRKVDSVLSRRPEVRAADLTRKP